MSACCTGLLLSPSYQYRVLFIRPAASALKPGRKKSMESRRPCSNESPESLTFPCSPMSFTFDANSLQAISAYL